MKNAKSVGEAELLLISDFPIEEEHVRHVLRLAGSPIAVDEIAFDVSRRWCTWPLGAQKPFGEIDSLGEHVFYCAAFLARNREAVTALHSLGCNIELTFKAVRLDEPLSLAAGTMKLLADMRVQLTIRP